MLEQIENVFPGFLDRVRRLPLVARVALLLAILAGLPSLVWVYDHRVSATSWFHREVRIPLYEMVVAALGSSLVATAVRWLWQQTRTRRELRRFLAEWLDFRQEFGLLCVRIDVYLLPSRQASNPFGEIEDLLPAISQYWSRRERIREHIFRVGENRLSSTRSARWEALKAKSSLFREREYVTPFSFLVDLQNPIAEWNHHHDEIWESLHLSDEFVEYLCFRYPVLRRIKPSGTPPHQGVNLAAH
jgi:hypothetical protein